MSLHKKIKVKINKDKKSKYDMCVDYDPPNVISRGCDDVKNHCACWLRSIKSGFCPYLFSKN